MRHKGPALAMCCALALATAPALAADPLVAPPGNPAAASDDWVIVSGTVQSVGNQHIVLDTGASRLLVDLDGYASPDVRPGERVTVTGRMEMPLDGPHLLNAASVDVPERNQRFYANPTDDGGGAFTYSTAPVASTPPPAAPLTLTGTVVDASAPDAFILATTSGTYAVDGRNVAPAFPARRLLIGDRISVSGSLDTSNLFDRRQIDAQSITLLAPTRAM